MPAIHLTAENFDSVISSGQLVFVDFWAGQLGAARA